MDEWISCPADLLKKKARAWWSVETVSSDLVLRRRKRRRQKRRGGYGGVRALKLRKKQKWATKGGNQMFEKAADGGFYVCRMVHEESSWFVAEPSKRPTPGTDVPR